MYKGTYRTPSISGRWWVNRMEIAFQKLSAEAIPSGILDSCNVRVKIAGS